MQNTIKTISTTSQDAWVDGAPASAPKEYLPLSVSRALDQEWWGFGGCFNEIGWDALASVSDLERERLMHDLFAPDGACKFTFCRIPIGASDYALEWYSHNENDGDFNMEKFSIERDQQYLLPYIRAAQKLCPEMRFFASPWSPPTWMKFPKACNHGTFIWTHENRSAYAKYFVAFVEAYRSEGIIIDQLHVQNEPVADQKFPSCVWKPEHMADFIREDLGPELKRRGLDTEIWVGTLNDGNYDYWTTPTLLDSDTRSWVSGIGYQWAGRGAVQRAHYAWPEMGLMQTENECGEGLNDWKHACHTFDLLQHYITNGVNAYTYWNMVLPTGGMSTWGWRQNAMVTIDNGAKQHGELCPVIRNYEFHVMRHFSNFIHPGAKRLVLTGPWAAMAVAFENKDGSRVAVFRNPAKASVGVSLTLVEDRKDMVNLVPDSITTLILET